MPTRTDNPSQDAIPARYLNRKTGFYDITLVDKAEKCRLSGCPLAGTDDPSCEHCTGPLAWTDHRGKRQGKCWSCTNCPMNGRGLPVCWAGCDGPNQAFACDGKSVETMGAIPEWDRFIEDNRERAEVLRRDDGDDDAFDSLDEIPERRTDDTETVTHALSESQERTALNVIGKILVLDGHGWMRFKGLLASGKTERECRENRRAAAALIGVRRETFRDSNSPAYRIIIRLAVLDADDWEILRYRVNEITGVKIAGMMNVSKQAISAREKRLKEKWSWYRTLIESLAKRNMQYFTPDRRVSEYKLDQRILDGTKYDRANRRYFSPAGVATPERQRTPRREDT